MSLCIPHRSRRKSMRFGDWALLLICRAVNVCCLWIIDFIFSKTLATRLSCTNSLMHDNKNTLCSNQSSAFKPQISTFLCRHGAVQIPALLHISRKFYRCWGQMMVHCQKLQSAHNYWLTLKVLPYAAVIEFEKKKDCMVIQSADQPEGISRCWVFKERFNHSQRSGPASLSHNHITNMTTAMKLNTVSLFLVASSPLWGFLLLCLRPFYLFFSSGSHPVHN